MTNLSEHREGGGETAVETAVETAAEAMAEAATEEAVKAAWGSLRPPSARDVKGRGSVKGLQAAPLPMSHLVVLDFEWTADNRKRMLPVSEITQFPSVLVRLDGQRSSIIDQFDTFVRPTLNPTLTPFSIELTAISQSDVDAAPTLVAVVPQYLAWLRGHRLVDDEGARRGSWSFCTWSDADIGGQLANELRVKGLAMPSCFDQWVDLKLVYHRRYKREPRGGLQACVERLGLVFDGRAHNGLVDSINTAKIALHMARGEGMHGPAFVFTRPTRGLDTNGYTYGSKASREARKQPVSSVPAVGEAPSGAHASRDNGVASSRATTSMCSRSGPCSSTSFFDDACLPDEVLGSMALPDGADAEYVAKSSTIGDGKRARVAGEP